MSSQKEKNMLETHTQPSSAAVRDPVCGMAIDPAQAEAERTLGHCSTNSGSRPLSRCQCTSSPIRSSSPGSAALRFAWACLGVLTLPVMFWAGSHYFSGMWQALKHRQANMYTLIAIGVSAAWLYSSVAVAAPQLFPSQALAQTFYDVTAVVIALVNLGLLLELR